MSAPISAHATGHCGVTSSYFRDDQRVGRFVFFDDGNDANNRDVVLFDGNGANFESPFDLPGWDLTSAGINYARGSANFVTYVSDGQDFGPNDDGTLRVNGTPIASGGIYRGLSPRTPGAGLSNGNQTDIRAFDITSLLSPGAHTIRAPCRLVGAATSGAAHDL